MIYSIAVTFARWPFIIIVNLFAITLQVTFEKFSVVDLTFPGIIYAFMHSLVLLHCVDTHKTHRHIFYYCKDCFSRAVTNSIQPNVNNCCVISPNTNTMQIINQ